MRNARGLSACPNCQAPQLALWGIGTERLEREVEMAFPDAVSRRMDSDTMRTPGSHEQVLAAFRAGEIKILLGTQMIAKELDFPNVTLVGVVNADTALHMPDFRAAERTFQLRWLRWPAARGGAIARVASWCRPLLRTTMRSTVPHGMTMRGSWPASCPSGSSSACRRTAASVRLIGRGPDEPMVRAFLNETAGDIEGCGRARGDHAWSRPDADLQDPQPLSLSSSAAERNAAAAPDAFADGGARTSFRRARWSWQSTSTR